MVEDVVMVSGRVTDWNKSKLLRPVRAASRKLEADDTAGGMPLKDDILDDEVDVVVANERKGGTDVTG